MYTHIYTHHTQSGTTIERHLQGYVAYAHSGANKKRHTRDEDYGGGNQHVRIREYQEELGNREGLLETLQIYRNSLATNDSTKHTKLALKVMGMVTTKKKVLTV
jgi:hypothetical protein